MNHACGELLRLQSWTCFAEYNYQRELGIESPGEEGGLDEVVRKSGAVEVNL